MEEVNIGTSSLMQKDDIPPVYRDSNFDDKDFQYENNANDFLKEWLQKQNSSATELYIPSIQGTVNLQFLKKYYFEDIKALFFSKGKITELKNIPEGLEILDIPYNELTELNGLPDTLITVNAAHNRLKKTDFSTCDKLKSINVSYNHLEYLENVHNLPESLEILHCAYNRLEQLDLFTTKQLKELYCNNNPKLKLTHVPDSVVHGNYASVMVSLKKSDTLDYVNIEEEYKEKVAKYFRMKSKYETQIKNSREKLNETFTKSRQDDSKGRKFPLHNKIKKQLNLKNDKPPCHGCGGKGGMLFKITSTKYQAFCNNEPQCDWKIIIHRGFFENREKMMYEYLEYMEGLKQRFIEGKMDSLFRYLDDKYTKANFEKRMKLYELYSTHLKSYLDTHNDCYYNEQKRQILLQKSKTIQEKLEEVKVMLRDQDEDLLSEAVDTQITEIRPLAQYIQRETYELMNVERDIVTDTFVLQQHPVLASKLDTLVEGNLSVERFGKIDDIEIGSNFYEKNENDDDIPPVPPSVNLSDSIDWGSNERTPSNETNEELELDDIEDIP